MRLSRAFVFMLGLLSLAPVDALAQPAPCAVGGRRLVLVEIASSIDPGLSKATFAHLAAELATRDMAVCDVADANAASLSPHARVVVTGSEMAFVNVRVLDDRSHTTVERVFDFSLIPPEGKALTLGISANALLSMLWTLAPKETKSTPPPPVVEVHSAPPAPASPVESIRNTATILGSLSDYSSGPVFYGPQVHVRRRFGRWLPSVLCGIRRAADLQALHGRVAFQDVHLGLELGWQATRADRRLALVVYGGTEGSWVGLVGVADPGSSSARGNGVALVLSGGVEVSLAFAHATRLILRTGGGQVLRSVRARDAGESLGGVQGLMWNASLGVGVSF